MTSSVAFPRPLARSQITSGAARHKPIPIQDPYTAGSRFTYYVTALPQDQMGIKMQGQVQLSPDHDPLPHRL